MNEPAHLATLPASEDGRGALAAPDGGAPRRCSGRRGRHSRGADRVDAEE